MKMNYIKPAMQVTEMDMEQIIASSLKFSSDVDIERGGDSEGGMEADANTNNWGGIW